MLAEHTNKEKMPCKPLSRYHLKGYAIIIIRVTAALLTMTGKTRKRQSTSRNSMCWQKHSLSIIAVHISPNPICTPMFIHEHHLGQQHTWDIPALLFNKTGWKTFCCHPCPATMSSSEGSCLSTLLLASSSQAGQTRVGSWCSSGSCFAKRHSRALYRLKGNSGSVTRSLHISWDTVGISSALALNVSLQGPQAGVPQQPQGKPDLVSVAFPSSIRARRCSSTTWAASHELPFGSRWSNLPALKCVSWTHQQKGSCRFGKSSFKQQKLKT